MNPGDPNDQRPVPPGVATSLGGSAIFPDPARMPAPDDPNGPMPDSEETHDATDEDMELLDTDSPEFDHTLRKRREQP